MNHLHTRSCYSLLESNFRIQEIVDTAIDNGFRHVCLTDHYSMFATIEFWKYCQSKGIHPVIGLEVDASYNEDTFNLVLLAKNDVGLQQLYKISSHYMCQLPQMSVDELASLTDQCIAITGGGQDSLDSWMMHDDLEKIQESISFLSSIWDSFYVSIAMNDSKFRSEKNRSLKDTLKPLHIKTVALSRIYYRDKGDVENLRILRAIDLQSDVQDQTLDVTFDRYFRSQDEMRDLYDQEDLDATDEIVAMCNVTMSMKKSDLPTFQNKLNIDNTQYLIKLCKKGLLKRLDGKLSQTYVSRLEYELSVITKMGFTNYFLIVWDFIREARNQDIYVGPGRGSAAGSLVAYCLGITHIDPIKNNLLFERFLNPERISMPDIDVDFPDDRREDVITYVRDKYGSKHVGHIVTFNTFKAKQVLRDVARVTGVPVYKVDALTKLIPTKPLNITLRKAYEFTDFRQAILKDKELKQLFDRCLPLEGLPKNISIHAAGIVISDQELEQVCPCVQIDESHYATQYTKEYLEELGLIKMDFLGIRNLTTIHSIVSSLNDVEDMHLNILQIPLNDSKTYQLLSKGDTLGVFQLESEGIISLLKRIQAKSFEDICAVLALYRPAAMEHIDEYLENRKDPSSIRYVDSRLEPILKETYGIMLYQEQAMQIAQRMGGFTLAQADSLRKAMGKKDMNVMKSYHDQFIQGALSNKYTLKTAEEIWNLMEKFAEYGFNKSHSYAYGLIAYQMAYLKANYPLYFYQYLLASVMSSQAKTSQYLYECQKRNIQVKAPDVNLSQESYSVQNGNIQMPFQILKGIGKSVYPSIIEERKKGVYKDYIDFVVRMTAYKMSENALRTLIYSGALDAFEYSRKTMAENLGQVLNYASIIQTKTPEGILFNYDVVSKPNIMQYKDVSLEKAEKEYEVFGFYLSEHPVMRLRQRYPKTVPLYMCADRNGYIEVIGRVLSFHIHQTKNRANMCFMTIQDETANFDIAIMPKIYELNKEQIQKNAFVYIKGFKDRPQSIRANQMKWIVMENET